MLREKRCAAPLCSEPGRCMNRASSWAANERQGSVREYRTNSPALGVGLCISATVVRGYSTTVLRRSPKSRTTWTPRSVLRRNGLNSTPRVLPTKGFCGWGRLHSRRAQPAGRSDEAYRKYKGVRKQDGRSLRERAYSLRNRFCARGALQRETKQIKNIHLFYFFCTREL